MKTFSVLPAIAGLVCILLAQRGAADATCDPISKYTTEVRYIGPELQVVTDMSMKWFLANTKPQYRTSSFDSSAVFYSSGLSDRAKQFARQRGKVTIWVSRVRLRIYHLISHLLTSVEHTGRLALRKLLDQRYTRKSIIMYYGQLSRRNEVFREHVTRLRDESAQHCHGFTSRYI